MYLITSDSHFGHSGIIEFERRSLFNDIHQHDLRIIELWSSWINSLKEDDTFYFLGDFCATGKERYYVDILREHAIGQCKKIMIAGNHDVNLDRDILSYFFDEIIEYPIYISNRVVLSHYPVAVYSSQINVHGHTHGMKLCDKNHLCAGIHVNLYNPITSKYVESSLGKVDKWCTKFLYEPWAGDYLLMQKHSVAIADSNGKIDLSASRLNYINKIGNR